MDIGQSNQDSTTLVYLRLKPVDNFCNFYSLEKHDKKLVTSQSNGNKKQFIFSDIFDELVSQKEVYEKCVKSRIDNEENFTIMSYGTSGSGKTFTLIGNLILFDLRNSYFHFDRIFYNFQETKTILESYRELSNTFL